MRTWYVYLTWTKEEEADEADVVRFSSRYFMLSAKLADEQAITLYFSTVVITHLSQNLFR